MSSIVSDIVRYRARSVISRYLHHKGELKVTPSPVNSFGVPITPSGPDDHSLSSEAAIPADSSSLPSVDLDSDSPTTPPPNATARVRFPPLADDFDVHSLDVADLLDYLSELSFDRVLKLSTARCYRRWLAAYLESEGHVDATRIRFWVIPHSPEYYEMLLAAMDKIETEKEVESAKITTADKDQLDLFSGDTSAPAGASDGSDLDADEKLSKDEIIDMMLETQQIKESGSIAEYDYVTPDVSDLLIAALTSKTAAGNPRYIHGELAAVLFIGTTMLGLRPQEWQHSNYHEIHSDPFTLLTLGPVVEVFTLKQEKRRDDNPLREKRLIVLDKFQDNEKTFIKGLIARMHSYDGRMDKVLLDVRKTITRAWQKLIKDGTVQPTNQIKKANRTATTRAKSVNLYTARHVFAEEVKRSGLYTRFELAAMIGHTTTVNQRYYTLGKQYKLKTYTHTLPRPWPGDALDIERWCDETMSNLSESDIQRLRKEGIFHPDGPSTIEEFFNP